MVTGRSSLIASFVFLTVSPLFAQPGGGDGARGSGGRLPEVGSMLPDVLLYDDRGEEFSTSSLRGQYSVLVFGCLT